MRYLSDLRRDRERLAAVPRATLDAPFGRMEYAIAGEGPPALIVHGVFGGCDFGVGVGRDNVPAGFRVVSPSRFGYLGSPFPPDPSPAAQADAFAVLLDHLGIRALPVVGFSAGSSSCLQLALRHLERVSRLVLISPNAPHPRPLPKPPRPLAPLMFSQPVLWALRRFAHRRLAAMAGTPRNFVATEREQAALDEIVDSLFPVAPRRPGTIYDGYIGNPDIGRYPLEEIAVPTLVVAALDDTLAPYEDTRAMTQRIAGAVLVTVPRGGHALTKLDPRAAAAVERFLAAPAPDPTSRPEEMVSRG